VHRLKYANLRAIAAPLAELMMRYLENETMRADLLVPVPLHPKRLRERGYNQSALLAGNLGRLVGVPVDETALAREKYILPQARTGSVEERRANVAGAFMCRGNQVNGKKVMVIDDVSTSGATLNACASALKAAGAPEVWGLTLAKEI